MKYQKFFIPSGEAGVGLEVVAAKPQHDGPYPSIIFNHGSTGRGKSGGIYGEGLALDGSGYSCNAEVAIAGFERAIEDVDAVVRHLRERPDVDQDQLAIGGASRGGILAIAHAGMRPNTFRGADNFNGGWLGRGCSSHETVNPLIFERGAPSGISTLWLHGSYDQYYRIGAL
ncbi:alpha/beta hydrolase family protein [Phyllobacterium sp. 22552]|uniref:alpha/beta hydrolase family protein n=1 Tax=Phyllobacterium sp. 22552 TaxID=3453941 RepID=UPI003F82B63C